MRARSHKHTHAHSYVHVQNGKGAFDYAKAINDEEKRAAVLTVLAEYSVMSAVATGKADLVEAGVAKGCNMEETDYWQNSYLHLSAEQGSVDVLRILLEADADVAAKNQVRGAVLSRCVCWGVLPLYKGSGLK
jgi:hypothetical protein